MGAGKTTIGRRLARELGIAFADTDEMIVAALGMTVAEIFAAEGEAGFRARELEAAREAFAGSAAVVSLGGGAVTHGATRALVAASAVRVYLQMPPQTIVARLRQSPTVRPLLGALPTLAKVEQLLRARQAYYREAEVTVAGDRGSTATIVRGIAALLRSRGEADAS